MRPAAQGATVLLADRDPRTISALEAALRRHRLRPERVGERDDWFDVIRRVQPDVVVLSERLEGMTALDTLVALRRVSAVPVVMLIERGGSSSELLYFGLGADDVVELPASPQVVAARVLRILQRSTAEPHDPALRVGHLRVDPYRNAVLVDGAEIDVTPVEYRMLATLAGAAGRAFTRAELLDQALPESDALERSVDVHVWSLRHKLERAGAPGMLETVRGVGYRLVAAGDDDAGDRGADRSISGRIDRRDRER